VGEGICDKDPQALFLLSSIVCTLGAGLMASRRAITLHFKETKSVKLGYSKVVLFLGDGIVFLASVVIAAKEQERKSLV